MYMNTPIQQYQRIHTANEGKTKLSHSNIKTAGAIEQFKRHEPHTWYSGQCSFHWGYILALLWINNDTYATSKPYNHLWTFLYQCLCTWMRPCRTDNLIVMCKSVLFFFSFFLLIYIFLFWDFFLFIKVGSKIKI